MEMLSPHFSLEECKCKCRRHKDAPYCPVSQRLLSLAEKIRDLLGEPMITRSVCRCAEHNAETPGASPTSKHVAGKAMDFYCRRLSPLAVYNVITRAWHDGRLPELGGVGLYDWGVHIDTEKASDRHLRRWDRRKGARA